MCGLLWRKVIFLGVCILKVAEAWRFINATSGVPCIMIASIIELRVPYDSTDGKNETHRKVHPYELTGSDSEVIGGNCGTQNQSILIQWTSNNFKNNMSILFESKANQDTFDYVLSEINLNVSDAIYPSDAKKDTLPTSFIFNDSIHVSKDSYYCENDRQLTLPEKSSPGQRPQLIMSKFRAEAFMTRIIMVAEFKELCVDETPLIIVGSILGVSAVLAFIYVIYLCRRN